jgi:CheY-like chemotaxis protein
MNLQALLVSSDDAAAEVLGRVLSGYGLSTERSSDPDTALARMQQQKFDALVVDFDDAAAAGILHHAQKLGIEPLGIALLADPSMVREVLNAKAHFVVYKPVSEESATAALRAAAALLKQERRSTVRIPVQAPVEITLADGRTLDGILLDLSESGMDVLMAEPQTVGAMFSFHFQLPEGSAEIASTGRVAWANPNGQTGVHFPDLDESAREQLKNWLKAATTMASTSAEAVTHCKLTDLSAGGCYMETGSPFPEGSMIDLCLKTDAGEVHTEGMVRVMHPGHGMGVEFPSRTEEQRAKVLAVFDFLRASADVTPQLSISPRALAADPGQFEHGQHGHDSEASNAAGEQWDDPLLDLLRRGSSLGLSEFLAELESQRNPQAVASPA